MVNERGYTEGERFHREDFEMCSAQKWRRDCFISLLLVVSLFSAPGLSDLVLTKVDRRIDLTSQIVRATTTITVENSGEDPVSEVLLAYPDLQEKDLAYISAAVSEGKGKSKTIGQALKVGKVTPQGMPSSLSFYSILLPNSLNKGKTLELNILSVFTHTLRPFPEKITQSDIQLVVFQDSAHFISPYKVLSQSLTVKLPGGRIESYTKLESSKIHGSEIKYGPFNDLPPFSYTPVVFHFETNDPFAVAHELTREIEVSHWGNVQITEDYTVVHNGPKSHGEFSRLDFQARPTIRGAYALTHLIASLAPKARNIYYRDAIGNISTSHVMSDSKKVQLVVEPRYPMFGGWRTSFTIGYGLPIEDFVFVSQGKRFLNIPFGSPMSELVVDKLIVKVVLPEGSHDISVSTPFPVKRGEEVKFSHLDINGRPVVILEKLNVVPEHNQPFQVFYRFSNVSLLREPLMLITGFFCIFIACITYMHVDMSLSKSSPSYIGKLQWEEARAAVQEFYNLVIQCMAVHDKLEASLRDLSRTGDIQTCKSVRKSADAAVKDHSKDLKNLLTFLQSLPPASSFLPKLNDVITKEKDLQDKILAKHAAVLDCYEKKLTGKETENRIGPIQQKISSLKLEIHQLLDYIDEI